MLEASAALIELHYFPCVQYFTKFILFDKVYMEQHEHYVKGSYRNRCHIAGANRELRLSIPLQKGKNQQMPIQEVSISYEEPWQAQHWTTIYSAYGKAPYFEYYVDEFKPFFNQRYELLWDFNLQILQVCLNLLSLQTSLEGTTSYEVHTPLTVSDYRNVISPKLLRQKKDETFMAVTYPQVFEDRNGFLPNLSVLDLLFCAGPQAPLILEQSINYDNITR